MDGAHIYESKLIAWMERTMRVVCWKSSLNTIDLKHWMPGIITTTQFGRTKVTNTHENSFLRYLRMLLSPSTDLLLILLRIPIIFLGMAAFLANCFGCLKINLLPIKCQRSKCEIKYIFNIRGTESAIWHIQLRATTTLELTYHLKQFALILS